MMTTVTGGLLRFDTRLMISPSVTHGCAPERCIPPFTCFLVRRDSTP